MAIGLAIPGTASEKPESLILFPSTTEFLLCLFWVELLSQVGREIIQLEQSLFVCLFWAGTGSSWLGALQQDYLLPSHIQGYIFTRPGRVSCLCKASGSRESPSCVCGCSTTDRLQFLPKQCLAHSRIASSRPAGGRGNSEIKKSWQIVQRREDIEENRKCVKLWDLRGCPGRSRGRLSLLIGRAAMRNRVKTSSSHFGNFDLLSLL